MNGKTENYTEAERGVRVVHSTNSYIDRTSLITERPVGRINN